MPARRILIDALSLTHGGGWTYVVNLVRELERDSRGFDFTLLAIGDRLAAEEFERVRLERVGLPHSPDAMRVVARLAYELLVLPVRARRFDLLYCLADISPPIASVPTVVALRNLNIYDRRFYDTMRLRMLERFARLGARRARKIVIPSRASADFIQMRLSLPPEKVAVVPHGASLHAFRSHEECTGGARVPYLFAPISVERHKNVDTVLVAMTKPELADLELWIAGNRTTDLEYAGAMEKLADELGVADRVRFLGLVPYREMLDYYRGALAMVFPSLLETFGHPLLEAMIAETPIVASDLPVFREIAGDIALFFESRSPEALAAAVGMLRSDPAAARERSIRGRGRVENFSWKRAVDELCSVFDSALART